MRAHALSLIVFAFRAAAASVLTTGDYIFVDSFESSDCTLPLACPAPLSGKACIAGQLSDAATTQPLHATFNVGLSCGGGAIGGPCDLALAVYDAAQFAANPATATPLPSGAIVADGCGRYRIPDLTVPASPYVVVAADDAPGNAGHMPTGTLHALSVNQRVEGLDTVATTTDTVALWSLTGQADFSQGTLLLRYATGGIPTSGVTAIRDGGATGGTCRYFSDTDAQRLMASPSAVSTGADGSALIANGAFGSYSGVGGESNGCHWSSINALTVAGAVLVGDVACIQ